MSLYQRNFECIAMVEEPDNTWSKHAGNLHFKFYDYRVVDLDIQIIG